jgi:hypothetical protein
MIKQQKEENNIYKCGFLCGRIARGIIKITEKTDLELCDTCHPLLCASSFSLVTAAVVPTAATIAITAIVIVDLLSIAYYLLEVYIHYGIITQYNVP